MVEEMQSALARKFLRGSGSHCTERLRVPLIANPADGECHIPEPSDCIAHACLPFIEPGRLRCRAAKGRSHRCTRAARGAACNRLPPRVGSLAGGWRFIPPSSTAGVSGEGPRHGAVRSPGQGRRVAGRTRQQEPEGTCGFLKIRPDIRVEGTRGQAASSSSLADPTPPRRNLRAHASMALGVSSDRGGCSGPHPGRQVPICDRENPSLACGAEP